MLTDGFKSLLGQLYISENMQNLIESLDGSIIEITGDPLLKIVITKNLRICVGKIIVFFRRGTGTTLARLYRNTLDFPQEGIFNSSDDQAWVLLRRKIPKK